MQAAVDGEHLAGDVAGEVRGQVEAGLGDGSLAPEPTMDVKNVANAVVHMASLPLDANVLFMTVMASKMPFVGRG